MTTPHISRQYTSFTIQNILSSEPKSEQTSAFNGKKVEVHQNEQCLPDQDRREGVHRPVPRAMAPYSSGFGRYSSTHRQQPYEKYLTPRHVHHPQSTFKFPTAESAPQRCSFFEHPIDGRINSNSFIYPREKNVNIRNSVNGIGYTPALFQSVNTTFAEHEFLIQKNHRTVETLNMRPDIINEGIACLYTPKNERERHILEKLLTARTLECSIDGCQWRFLTKPVLKNHLIRSRHDTPEDLEKLNENFFRKIILKLFEIINPNLPPRQHRNLVSALHRSSSRNKQRYKCEHCNYCFGQKNDLMLHQSRVPCATTIYQE